MEALGGKYEPVFESTVKVRFWVRIRAKHGFRYSKNPKNEEIPFTFESYAPRGVVPKEFHSPDGWSETIGTPHPTPGIANTTEAEEETNLHDASIELMDRLVGDYDEMDEDEEYSLVEKYSQMVEPINKFFDGVMVMCPDEHLRANRLAQLSLIDKIFLESADFSQVVV